MATMYLADNGGLIRFEKKAFALEKDWQDLLSRFPQLLSDGVPDSSGRNSGRWLLVTEEYPLLDGEGSTIFADHLFLDKNGIPTLVEVKRARNPENKRTVVAQMLDYAAALTMCEVNDIQNQLSRRLGAEAEVKLLDFLGELDPADFWQQVKTNLEAKKIRMVFVADEIPLTLRRLIEFLNEQMRVAEVIGIEIGRLTSGDKEAFVPVVVGRTAEAESRKSAPQKVERTLAEFVKVIESKPQMGDPTARQNLQIVVTWGGDPANGIEMSVSPAAQDPRLVFSKNEVKIFGVQADGGIYLYSRRFDGQTKEDFSQKLQSETGLSLKDGDASTCKLHKLTPDTLDKLLALIGQTS